LTWKEIPAEMLGMMLKAANESSKASPENGKEYEKSDTPCPECTEMMFLSERGITHGSDTCKKQRMHCTCGFKGWRFLYDVKD